jgi:hypothetical protein
MAELTEFVPGRLWLREYPIRYAGTRFLARMTVLRSSFGKLLVHSENIGDRTPGTDWARRAWWKFVTRMWNRVAPAPEYRIGWGTRKVVGAALSRILDWDFQPVVIARGDLIEHDAKTILRSAWARPLRAIGTSPTA